MSISLRSAVVAALLAAAPAQASTIFADPGSSFGMPGPGEGYQWTQSLDGVAPGEVVLFFTVNVPAGGAFLETFQVFSGCEGPSSWASFDLMAGPAAGPVASWTEVQTDKCKYHDFLGVHLPSGPVTFQVTLTDAPIDPAPLDIRFGDVVPAIPLPPAMLGLGAALVLLAGLRRRAG